MSMEEQISSSEKPIEIIRNKRIDNDTSKVHKQILLLIFTLHGYFSLGTIISFPSVAFSDIDRHNSTIYDTNLQLDNHHKDMIGSMTSLGALPGAWIAGILSNKFGRRQIIGLCGFTSLIGWFGVAFLHKLELIICARLVSGFVVGAVPTCSAAYIAETVDSKYRGIAGISTGLAVRSGQLFTVVIGYFFHYYWVALMNCIFPVIVLTAAIFYLPESPAHLIVKGKEDEARSILSKIRNEDDVENEIIKYNKSNKEKGNKNNILKELIQPKIFKSILIVSMLFFAQTFCGYMVFVVNTSRIFKEAGSSIEENIATIIASAVQVLGGIVSLFTAKRLGNKRSIMVSLTFVSTAVMAMALYTYIFLPNDTHLNISSANTTTVNHKNDELANEYGWIPLLCLVICLFGACLGILPTVYFLSAEYFPAYIRPVAGSVCISCCTFFQFLSLQLYTPMQNLFTISGLYLFYAIVGLIAIPFTAIFVRETKGKHVG